MSDERDQFKERVRAATNIVQLIGETVKLKRVGQEWKGLCPFHDDRHESFDVNEAKGKYICRSCQAGGDAFTFMQATESIGFRESVELLARRAGIPLPGKPIADDERVEHVYEDAEGIPVARKIRLMRGGMTVRGERGKLIWFEYPHDGHWYTPSKFPLGREACKPPKVLYRLPEVLAAIREGRPIAVAEGELCADALASLGIAATCNADGASRGKPKWTVEHAQQLRGARCVYVFADDDESGVAHAGEVARTLAEAAHA